MGMNDRLREEKLRAHGTSSPAAVELHIDELVLTGFAPGDRFHIRDAVERELTRLLSADRTRSFGSESIAVERVDGGRFQVAPGAKAQTVGGQIAETLYRQISPQQKRTSVRREAKAKPTGR